jgi:predicted DNA-binding transcriptional regulator YafY
MEQPNELTEEEAAAVAVTTEIIKTLGDLVLRVRALEHEMECHRAEWSQCALLAHQIQGLRLN